MTAPGMTAPAAWFVTGTNTDAGKTLAASALLHALSVRGVRAAWMKPVAAGAVWRDGRWQHEDVERLAAAAALRLPLELAAPYRLREAASPHIAAALENVEIDPAHLLACYRGIAQQAQAVVVEGAGGFRVPLTLQFDTAELARRLGLPVILVVGLRLGCLSHALLTAEAIRARGLTLAGWVANRIDAAMPHAAENVALLRARLGAPFLGEVPWLAAPDAAAAAACLDFSLLEGWPRAAPGTA